MNSRFLDGLSKTLFNPVPDFSLHPVVVPLNSFDDYFERVYNYINIKTNPILEIISRENFVNVCKLLLKSRLDAVYQNVIGVYPEDRVKLIESLHVPTAISVVINSVGLVEHNGMQLYPVTENPAEDNTTNIKIILKGDTLLKFSSFVFRAKNGGVIKVGKIERQKYGTSFWLLNVFGTGVNVDNSSPYFLDYLDSIFHGITPDADKMAHIVRNGQPFNGSHSILFPMAAHCRTNQIIFRVIRRIPALFLLSKMNLNNIS